MGSLKWPLPLCIQVPASVGFRPGRARAPQATLQVSWSHASVCLTLVQLSESTARLAAIPPLEPAMAASTACFGAGPAHVLPKAGYWGGVYSALFWALLASATCTDDEASLFREKVRLPCWRIAACGAIPKQRER